MDYSITYRPKPLTDEMKERFQDVIKKVSLKYYIGYESADETKAINHLQCHITSNHSRTNLLRRAIQNADEEMTYTKYSLCIKDITHNTKYQLGYCQKELKGGITNYPEDLLKECLEIFNKGEGVKKVKLNDNFVTTDKVLRAFVKWIEDHNYKNPSVTLAKQFCVYLWKNKEINWNTYCKMNFKEMDEFIGIYFNNSQCLDNFKGIHLKDKQV